MTYRVRGKVPLVLVDAALSPDNNSIFCGTLPQGLSTLSLDCGGPDKKTKLAEGGELIESSREFSYYYDLDGKDPFFVILEELWKTLDDKRDCGQQIEVRC